MKNIVDEVEKIEDKKRVISGVSMIPGAICAYVVLNTKYSIFAYVYFILFLFYLVFEAKINKIMRDEFNEKYKN